MAIYRAKRRGIQEMALLYAAMAVWTVSGGLVNGMFENEVDCDPQHVHLSFGEAPDQVSVVWATRSPCQGTEVEYGMLPWELKFKVTGTRANFTGPHQMHGLHYLHKATLTGLKGNTTYYYRPLCSRIGSRPFFFRSPFATTEWSPQVLVVGDLGAESQLLPLLNQRALSGRFSATLQLGGLSSYFSDDNGTAGDQLMQELENVASLMPFMTAPGDYERAGDDPYFSYRHRFSMPGSVWPMPPHVLWYSFDLGPVHFVSVCTALYLHGDQALQQRQHAWLMNDLGAANRARDRKPWIVVMARHPMYCPHLNDSDCAHNHSLVRTGLEETLYAQGVDLILESHSQGYQRLYPLFKGVVLSSNFTNPPAPVHITIGTASTTTTTTTTTDTTTNTDITKNNSSHTKTVAVTKPPSSVGNGTDDSGSANSSDSSSNAVGNATNVSDGSATETVLNITAFQMVDGTEPTYGRLYVINNTHAYWELLSGGKGREGKVVDTFWLIQENHGPFHLTDLPKEVEEKIKPHLAIDGNTKPDVLNGDGANHPHPKPHPLGDIITAVDDFHGVLFSVLIGVGALLVVVLVVVCRLRQRRRAGRKGMVARRWDSMDYKYGKTRLTNDDDDDDDDYGNEFKDANDAEGSTDPDDRLQTKRLIDRR